MARAILLVAGVTGLGAAAAFLLFPAVAAAIFPWELSRLSRIFIASILAAIGAPPLWLALVREYAAAAAGALNLLVTNAGVALYLLALGPGAPATGGNAVFGWVCAAGVVVMAGIFLWSRRFPFRDQARLPAPARWSFVLFAVMLIVFGSALVLQYPGIFPWPLSPNLSALYGFIFLGAAVYFIHALIVPVWGNAKGQLVGFLAYDIVLLPPYLLHFGTVDPSLRLSLTVYTAVLVFSALVAIYYLFIDPATRLRFTTSGPALSTHSS